MKRRKAVILGAGITGLSTAYKLSSLGWQIIIIEKEKFIGGLATTFKRGDLSYDLGPHKIYTQIPLVEKEIKQLLGKDILTHPKKSSLYLFGKFLKYPISFGELLSKMPKTLIVKFGISYLMSTIKGAFAKVKPKNSEEYFKAKFGNKIYQVIFKPLFSKVYGNPKKLNPGLAETRVSFPSLLEVVKSAISPKNRKPTLSAEKFFYPKRGILELSQKMANFINKKNGKIYLNSKIEKINLTEKTVSSIKFSSKNKKNVVNKPDILISTIPLNYLIKKISPEPFQKVFQSSSQLKYRPLTIVYLLINKKRLFKDAFIFFPEKKFSFQRLSEQKAFSKTMIPENKTLLMAEITHSSNTDLKKISEKKLVKLVIKELKNESLIKGKDVENYFCRSIPKAYPFYNTSYEKTLKIVLNYLEQITNLYTVGRQGLFLYTNMDHNFDMGIKIAKHLESKKNKNEWLPIREGFSKYKIID